MGSYVTLAFFKSHFSGYQDAKKSGAVYSVRLDFGEAHLGMAQTAVWDAMEVISETKRCFGLSEENLSFVLLNNNDDIIDAG